MPDRPSGALPLDLLITEIDEVGRSLARFIRPGSPIERERRARVRAVLKDGFLATQEKRSFEQLSDLLTVLRTLQIELEGHPESYLIARVGRLDQFGAVDDVFVKKGEFSTHGEQTADALAADLEARIERTLSTLTANDEEEGKIGAVRPLRHRDEPHELVTKKV